MSPTLEITNKNSMKKDHFIAVLIVGWAVLYLTNPA